MRNVGKVWVVLIAILAVLLLIGLGVFRWYVGGYNKAVNFEQAAEKAWADIDSMGLRYDPSKLREGWNEMASGERIFFISNPALGLWGPRARFER